ncbi:potassium channel family protein [Vibrio barjaei]|uniref:potassium channel family protein n=1 Tax=Vibrio barjaei TaxID=1676683 RepID=UPI002284C874|nr:potassium channel family protein [Vibrio barjaei]MCY9872943.1 potassium channel family protein [Vibrio barjaei]
MTLRQKRKNRILARAALVTGAYAIAVLLAIPIFYLELLHPDANITTLEDAFWFQFSSLTTIGWGKYTIVNPDSRILFLFSYLLTRVSLVFFFFSAIHSRPDELNIDDRLTAIQHDINSIHGEVYDLNRDQQQEIKRLRRENQKDGEINISTIDSLIDLTNNKVCKRKHLQCHFDLSDLYDRETELWIQIKQQALVNGIYSIGFKCGVYTKLKCSKKTKPRFQKKSK